MSAEMAQKLIQGGIKAVRNGETELARKAFTQALKLDPDNEAAWLGMATITEGASDKRRILKRVLEINPDNERAKEALRRLGDDQETVDFAGDELPGEETDAMTRTAGEVPALTGMPPGDTGELSDFPIPDISEARLPWEEDDQPSEDVQAPAFLEDVDVAGIDEGGSIFDEPESEQEPETEPEPTLREPITLRSSEEVFQTMPAPVQGQGGVPIFNRNIIQQRSKQASEEVQAYLEDMLVDYLTPEYTWTRKTRGRAGSGEYRTFILQVTTASFVAIFIIGAALTAYIASSAEAQRFLFGPSDTPQPSATFTPTATPGVTNTPSPTPEVPATSTPELNLVITPGNPDPNFPPEPTLPYYPVPADSLVDEAMVLIERGDLDTAKDLLDEAVAIEIETGSFPPTYRLSQWYLLNDDPEQAREVLTEWEEQFSSNASLFDNSQSLLLIAQARVDLYEARNGLGDRAALINSAQTNLERSIGLTDDDRIIAPDRVNTEAYILLAESYALRGEITEAIEVLNTGLDASFNDRILANDVRLRLAATDILADAGRYPEAFQQLYWALQVNPFSEDALIRQAELALESGQPGLGVLYAQQYLLYYPGSLHGFYLLGQAREMESKFDLALNAYSRAVAGDVTDDDYTGDPYFLENLLARADLLIRQGRRDLATDDFSLALELTGDDPAIRIRRLEASYAAGNYEDVLADVEDLLGEGDLPQNQVLYYQALALVDQAREDEEGAQDENYDLAIEALDQALALGLSSDQRENALEYLALANLEERNFGNALDAIESALELGVTADRVYLRGLILEGQGSISDALLDYEFVVTWGQYYSFPFFEDARERYDTLLARVGR